MNAWLVLMWGWAARRPIGWRLLVGGCSGIDAETPQHRMAMQECRMGVYQAGKNQQLPLSIWVA